MFQRHSEYIDTDAGFHVVELRDGRGNRHLVQIALRHDTRIACGKVTPNGNLGELDPKAMVAEVVDQLNASHAAMLEYAAKHGVMVK